MDSLKRSMKSIRTAYDKLSPQTRSRIRSLLPDSVKCWYAHKNTDVYLISYPKCGRTWLRLMIGKSIADHYSVLRDSAKDTVSSQDEDILFLRWVKKPHKDIPHITVIHEDRPMIKAPEELERSKKRYRNKKVIFLSRDPRDVIVSSYFEMSKRGRLFGDNPYESRQAVYNGSLSDFINRRVGGFDTILAYYNIWAENRRLPSAFLLVRYEDLRINPHGELRKILDFLGLKTINDETVANAVAYTSFENMRLLEKNGEFNSSILKPANMKDEESYKTRKGEVKGFVKYLSDKEIEMLNRKMQSNLSSFYGYTS